MTRRESAIPHPPVGAVVLSTGGSAEAYDIVRSLGREGIRTTIAVPERHNIAGYSRYCSGAALLPEFKESNFREIVLQLAALADETGSRPVLFYVSDPELTFVWRFRQELRPFYRFLLPPDDVLSSVLNKVNFATFAKRYALPVPETREFSCSEHVAASLASIRFPCIVKPAFTHDWQWDTEVQRRFLGPYKKALRRFSTADELLAFCRMLPDRRNGFVIQSYLDGRDELIVSFHGYFDEQSSCLGYFLGRKIRTYPPHTGSSAYVRTIHNEELAADSIAYLQRIGFCGIVKIDYKWDAANGRYVILEINPRYNLWELLGTYAGANLAAAAFRDQSGTAARLSGKYAENARLIFFKQDLRAFVSGYRTAGEWTLRSYVQSLAGVSCYRVLQINDPLPWIVSMLHFIGKNMKRLMHWIARRRNAGPPLPVLNAYAGTNAE